MRRTILSWLILAMMASGAIAAPVILETSTFRYSIADNGRNLAFEVLAHCTNYLRSGDETPCALAVVAGQRHAATRVVSGSGRLRLGFGETGVEVELKVETRPAYVALTVESITGGTVEALTFVNVPLSLRGSPEEPFGACALALNLITRVDALPALQSELKATCDRKFGLLGAKVALAAAPMAKLLATLQDTLSQASELPVCKAAGP